MSDPYEYTARIRFDPDEVVERFTVIIFLGKVPEDPKEWLVSPSAVGSFSAYSPSIPGRRRPPIASEGFVNIPNDIILERSGLKSLEPRFVEPYLHKELKWRVQKIDDEGTPITLASLEVKVLITQPSDPEIGGGVPGDFP